MIILILLLLITFISICALAYYKFVLEGRNSQTVLTPDYAPQTVESNAQPTDDQDDEKLDQPPGGGAVSLTYSKEVSIDLNSDKATLMFANPTKSNQDMILQIVIGDTIIVQSGRIIPGNKVESLSLIDGAKSMLSPGGYDGKFVVYYYQQDTGERAVVNTEIPLVITVT